MGKKLRRRLIAELSFFFLILMSSVMTLEPLTMTAEVSAQPSVPYELGNWTYVGKPVLPLKVNASQIPIGANWTYVYTLNANHTYHVYFYGAWINYDPYYPKTDYDIFVYDPNGELESYHTEAAGLPEHLGTTVDQPFFTPKQTGNYSFFIKNDPRESQGEEEGTFMLIEHIEPNRWYQRYLVGKVNDMPVENTSWAYEFSTTSKRIEVWIDVPDTLDMYEARLYLMANPSKGIGDLLNDVPLAWEPGLYGGLDDLEDYGGYNLDSRGFRHTEAMASCEFPGQDMLINYTSPYEGNSLYHLVLIAEDGFGSLNFTVKTDFEPPSLSVENPIEKAYPNNETTITAHINDESSLKRVLLNYTIDDWKTWTSTAMSASQNQTYIGTIPEQPAGVVVKYKILAVDIADNSAEVNGSYVVKNPANVSINLSNSTIDYGENITVTGVISPSGATVTLNYTLNNTVVSRLVSTNSSGFFNDVYMPNQTGIWTVSASWYGNESYFGASSGYKNFTVNRTPMSLICNVSRVKLTIGENVTIFGSVNPIMENMSITLAFTMPNGSAIERYVYTNSNGTFIVSFRPNFIGTWRVQAKFDGDDLRGESYSELVSFFVADTWINQYMMHIIIGAVAVIIVFVAVVFIRKRRYG
ncbi:hypothetical protein DRO69_05235 [Candidatus Bathyarchaeota archaeon]|nr:MAG: hypothetical protein DRO69_05235 [Candidatus Bathyarchaeota archaeon]